MKKNENYPKYVQAMRQMDAGKLLGTVARELNMGVDTIKRMRSIYLKGSELAMLQPAYSPHLEAKKKEEIVLAIKEKGLSLYEAASIYVLPACTLGRWRRAYDQYGLAGLERKRSGSRECSVKKSESLSRRKRSPSTRDWAEAIQGLRPEHRLDLMLEIKKMARSTFYYNLQYRLDKWEIERQRIVEIYYENRGRYGYRRIQKVMQNEGYVISGKSVRKLMKEAGIKCEVRMKKYRSYKGQIGRIAPNLLERNFTATRPYEKLVTDVTEFSLFGAKLYLSPVLDLYNGELVNYTIYSHPVLEMVTNMIEGTIAVIGSKTNAILHSDQGWQYQHKEYQNLLKKNHLRQSMSRKGNCLDNAVMENFFGLLKSELLYLQTFDSLDHFKEELEKYLKYYNNDRIKLKLDGMSPNQTKTRRNESGTIPNSNQYLSLLNPSNKRGALHFVQVTSKIGLKCSCPVVILQVTSTKSRLRMWLSFRFGDPEIEIFRGSFV